MRAIFKRVFGSSADGKFGIFAGVFTPSVLTILGLIMYLRPGWVVGHAGLLGALAIVLIAHASTVVTGLSISAIATNRTAGRVIDNGAVASLFDRGSLARTVLAYPGLP